MTITELLQSEEALRVTSGDTWMYYDQDQKEWVIRGKLWNRRYGVIATAHSEDIAVARFRKAIGIEVGN